MSLNFKKICPRCKIEKSDYHLMMSECDECIGKISEENKNIPEKYTQHALGILVLNPEWVRYQENLK